MQGFEWLAWPGGHLHITLFACVIARAEIPHGIDPDSAASVMPILVNEDRIAGRRQWCELCRESLKRQKWNSCISEARDGQQQQAKASDEARNLEAERRHYNAHNRGKVKPRQSCVICKTAGPITPAAIAQRSEMRKQEVATLKRRVKDREPDVLRRTAQADRLEAAIRDS